MGLRSGWTSQPGLSKVIRAAPEQARLTESMLFGGLHFLGPDMVGRGVFCHGTYGRTQAHMPTANTFSKWAKKSECAVMFSQCDDVITSSNHAQAQMRLEQREYRPEGGWGEAIVALRHGTKQPDQLWAGPKSYFVSFLWTFSLSGDGGWRWIWDRSPGLLRGVPAGRRDNFVRHLSQSVSHGLFGPWHGESTWGQVELPTLCKLNSPYCAEKASMQHVRRFFALVLDCEAPGQK